MPATRTETIEYVNFENPTGLPVASIVVTFTAAAVPANTATQTVPPGTLTVTQLLEPDTYAVTVQAFDASVPPAPIGPPATETFTIGTTTTLTVQIPGSVTGMTTPGVLTPPTAAPNAPVIGTAVAGSGSILAYFTTGESDTSNMAASFTATAQPGGLTATGTVSPLRIKGLTQGVVYTVTVVATNAVGISPPSAPSNAVTPSSAAVVPDAPTIGTASDGPTSANISFVPPVNDGGSPVLDYTATSSPGGISATGTVSPLLVVGLTTGTPYTFTVTARNVVGISPPSTPSNVIVPA